MGSVQGHGRFSPFCISYSMYGTLIAYLLRKSLTWKLWHRRESQWASHLDNRKIKVPSVIYNNGGPQWTKQVIWNKIEWMETFLHLNSDFVLLLAQSFTLLNSRKCLFKLMNANLVPARHLQRAVSHRNVWEDDSAWITLQSGILLVKELWPENQAGPASHNLPF